jgi:hypothetical protein
MGKEKSWMSEGETINIPRGELQRASTLMDPNPPRSPVRTRARKLANANLRNEYPDIWQHYYEKISKEAHRQGWDTSEANLKNRTDHQMKRDFSEEWGNYYLDFREKLLAKGMKDPTMGIITTNDPLD